MSKITAYFINLPAKLVAILLANSRTEKSKKKTDFDGLKVAEHGAQYLDSLRKRFRVSSNSSSKRKFTDFAKNDRPLKKL